MIRKSAVANRMIKVDQIVCIFFPLGKVGDWKNHFTVAQNEQFDNHYTEKMKKTTLPFRTQI